MMKHEKSGPAHPLCRSRLALYRQPTAAARRMHRAFPPRLLAGRLFLARFARLLHSALAQVFHTKVLSK